jgi:hypothetical protein
MAKNIYFGLKKQLGLQNLQEQQPTELKFYQSPKILFLKIIMLEAKIFWRNITPIFPIENFIMPSI